MRALALLISCVALGMVWVLGSRLFGPLAGALATLFAAAAPLAVQQAHYYTVDGPFSLLVLIAVFAASCLAQRRRLSTYILGGLAVGLAAAVRPNGLLLGLVLLAGHLVYGRRRAVAPFLEWVRGELLRREIWIAALGAVGILVALEPYLLFSHELLWRAESTDDLLYSMQVARGDIWRPWTIYYHRTTPYLYYLTDLLPLVAGSPLAVALLAGFCHAVYRRRDGHVVILVWIALDFFLIGGLFAKHVRYLLPSLLLLGALCGDMWQSVLQTAKSWRRLAKVAAIGVCLHVALYGVAFARIYHTEDSRIQAGRWIVENAPTGSAIAVERGGFSVSGVIDGTRYDKRVLDTGRTFGTRGYLSCDAAADFLYQSVADVDYVAITDVNRYLQFTAVPDLFPATASFYSELASGDLGFEVAHRFKSYPELLGLRFDDDDGEPSFLGFDHPTVYILRRRSDFAEAWSRWRRELLASPLCADRALGNIAAMMTDDPDAAAAGLEQLELERPDLRVADLMRAHIHRWRGETDREEEAIARYASGYLDPSRAGHLIPWAAAKTFARLGLADLVASALRDGARRKGIFKGAYLESLANTYVMTGAALVHTDLAPLVGETCRLATEISPTRDVLNNAAGVLLAAGDLEASADAYARALVLDGRSTAARVGLAWIQYLQGDVRGAIASNREILRDESNSTAHYNLALARLAAGDIDAAATEYARAVAVFGSEEGVRLGAVDDLRALIDRGNQVEAGRRILDTHWPFQSGGGDAAANR